MGFDGLFFARADYQDRAQRIATKTMEMIWKGSANLGEYELRCNTYLGQSKSSESDALISHLTLEKPFVLYGVIEKPMLCLSVVFDHSSTNIIIS